jgi:hypothetical protein
MDAPFVILKTRAFCPCNNWGRSIRDDAIKTARAEAHVRSMLCEKAKRHVPYRRGYGTVF